MPDINEVVAKLSKRVTSNKDRTVEKPKLLKSTAKPVKAKARDKQPKSELNAAGWPRRWLLFTDGKIVDPRDCPEGRHAHNHWREVSDATDKPNCVCMCTLNAQEQEAVNV